MREILFRGKRVDNGEWAYGDYWHLSEKNFYCISDKEFNRKVDPETVGQFTGLTDKNGRKIFIDDIVKITAIQPKHSLSGVVIQTKSGTYVIEDKNKDCWLLDVMNDRTPLFVIGNIHDNPELLEVTK